MVLDLTTLPQYVGNALGTNALTGGMLISFFFLICIIMLTSEITDNSTILMAVGIITIIIETGLNWVPTWVTILILMIVSLQYGNVAENLMGGD